MITRKILGWKTVVQPALTCFFQIFACLLPFELARLRLIGVCKLVKVNSQKRLNPFYFLYR